MQKWLKTGLFIALIALLATPMSAFATAEEDKYELDVASDVKDGTLTVTATIEGAESAESGEWQIVPLGPNKAGKPAHAQQSTDLSFTGSWSDLQPGKYCFQVHYTGKLDGQTANTVLKQVGKKDRVCVDVGEESKEEEEPKEEEPAPGEEPTEPPVSECTDFENISEEDFHEIAVDYKDSGDTIKVTATFPDAKNVEGAWELLAGLFDADEPVVVETKVAGNTVNFSIPKSQLSEDGDYLILVVFSGTVDGKECQWGLGFDGFFLEGEDTVTPPTKEVPKPKTPEGKERVIKNAQGGKMPNTAVPMVTNLAFGALLMVAGAGLLVFRRFSHR
ncbi:hypothetical protein [Desmospora profundinema]|uniref:LPXTG cell wall anchor domain-containing protein n=1 Tax=Desmospora profundinema TaxID=1571184 RepID=A0ABU1IIN7_9BACL|nr:hypothetical protein [Desmospora profundinema]MDR6224629.1 hypothetical protein [Desmospora profundinema]